MLKTLRSELDSLGWIIRMAAVVAVAGALYKEMRLPPGERTWHGRLLGFVPYDFRMPTPAKLMRSWWNPGSDRVISDMPFGVGWSVNLAALADKAQQARADRAGEG
jgi:hypothetical protein